MLRSITLVLTSWIGLSASTWAASPNVVLIVCDNLGYGDVEPFGSELHRTPALVRMAREGRRFTHFYVSAGVCTPSRASFMTGCYAQRVGMHDNPRDGRVLRPISPYGLHPDEVTIAEALKGCGYATGIIGKWHLGDQPDFLPTRQGFDEFFGIPYSDDMTAAVGQRLGDRYEGNRWPPLPLMENDTVVEAPVDRNGLTKRYTDRAIAFLRRHADEPFFLFLSHAMPGSTRTPFASEEFRGRSRNGPWGDAVEELDWSTGRILDELVELEIDDETLVIWTSDNGAPLAQDPQDPSRGSNAPLGGRGYTTAEGAFRVPTLMWWPGTVPAGTTCDELVTSMDLLPTLAPAANDSPRRLPIDGRDVMPLVVGRAGAVTPHEAFLYYERDQLQAVRSGRWKLYVPLEGAEVHPHFPRGTERTTALLFDVVDDPGEERNVAADHPETVSRLSKLAASAREDLGDRGRPGAGQRKPGRVENPRPVLRSDPENGTES